MFASLALRMKKKPTHNWKTPSFLLHVPRKSYRYTKTHICIHTQKNTGKGFYKGKDGRNAAFPSNSHAFLLIKMPILFFFIFFFHFLNIRNWNQHFRPTELSQALCTDTFSACLEQPNKICRKTAWQHRPSSEVETDTSEYCD